MIENDVERIEKKVDLIFKILLDLKVVDTGYIEDLIPVYDLIAKKDTIENYPTQDEIQDWENKLNDELNRLNQDYKQGNFLSKEKDKIKQRRKYLEEELIRLLKLSNNKLKFDNKSIETYKINLFKDLEDKLGVTGEYDKYSYRKLIREKDNLKTNIQGLIKELHDFMDNKGSIIK